MITEAEKMELARIIDGGAYDEAFWKSRWHQAKKVRPPSYEQELRVALRDQEQLTVQGKRAARKLVSKLKKLAGKKRAFTQAGYAQDWDDEQKRLDNLQHAAIYIHRANTNFHFYA